LRLDLRFFLDADDFEVAVVVTSTATTFGMSIALILVLVSRSVVEETPR
jgi:hypothetical protein